MVYNYFERKTFPSLRSWIFVNTPEPWDVSNYTAINNKQNIFFLQAPINGEERSCKQEIQFVQTKIQVDAFCCCFLWCGFFPLFFFLPCLFACKFYSLRQNWPQHFVVRLSPMNNHSWINIIIATEHKVSTVNLFVGWILDIKYSAL